MVVTESSVVDSAAAIDLINCYFVYYKTASTDFLRETGTLRPSCAYIKVNGCVC